MSGTDIPAWRSPVATSQIRASLTDALRQTLVAAATDLANELPRLMAHPGARLDAHATLEGHITPNALRITVIVASASAEDLATMDAAREDDEA